MATYESKKYGTIPVAATQIADGSVTNSEYQFINSLSSNAQTQITALDTAKLNLAGGTITGNVTITDNDHLYIGNGQDIDVFSDGSTGFIKGNDLRLQSSTSENYITAAVNGATKLFYDNSQKLETTSAGATISGTLTATTFSGSGASLTSLPAGNLTGTVADARISTLTASKLTGALPAIDGSNLTGIDAVPSGTDAIGAIREFALYYKGSGTPSTGMVISIGDTVTPSTYDTNNMYLGVPEVLDINFPTAAGSVTQVGQMRGFRGGTDPAGKTRGPSGTWRCIAQARYTEGNSGGPNGITWHISLAGLFQRIS